MNGIDQMRHYDTPQIRHLRFDTSESDATHRLNFRHTSARCDTSCFNFDTLSSTHLAINYEHDRLELAR
jgi:hypothetical protein